MRLLKPACNVEGGLAAALPSLVETAWQLQPSRLHQPSVDKVSTYALQLKAMKDANGQNASCVLPDLVFPMKTHRVFIPRKPAASTRRTLRQTFSTFSNTSAGLMGQTYWGKQPRAQSANIKGSGCAALRAHHLMAAPRPPATAHPRQNQYMWTLKMQAPGIRL